ncbi:MAG: dihydropteroate synthase [Alphaproteobacteria bacterium]|nr:dihydropteroate synthase [Alphaproteobacteria bacterium]
MAKPVHMNHVIPGGPHIMGVVNVTPDSFSDGGKFSSVDKAIEHGVKLVSEGAGILDIGGESTRPGAKPVDPVEEIRRVVPVIEGLRGKVKWISVDTRNAVTMEAALKAGANAINDISALGHDSRSVHVASEAKVPVFFMHMQGVPETMQKNTSYKNVVEEVFQFLQNRISFFETRRIDDKMLVADPGIGFGKTVEDNLLILGNISRFHDLGLPLMLGVSRKSFIAKLSKDEPPDERIPGSLAGALWGLSQGVQFFRVHDVKETAQAFKIYQAIINSGTE